MKPPSNNTEAIIQKAVTSYLHKLTSKAGKASAAKGSPSWFTPKSGQQAAKARWGERERKGPPPNLPSKNKNQVKPKR